MQYYICPIGPLHLQVAKFDDRSGGPLEVYDIHIDEGSSLFSCNCPASRSVCKHVTMVGIWLGKKKRVGWIYDDELGKFIKSRLTGLPPRLKSLLKRI